jgi:hypothetical protein
VSRRGSTEYSLWGEESGMALSLSASRESLATVSDMSFGSPPLAGHGAGGMHAAALHSGGLHPGPLNPGGLSIGGMPPIGPVARPQPDGTHPPAAAPASLFQNFGALPGGGGAQDLAGARSCGGVLDAGFSLFCNFPTAAAANQQATDKRSLASGSPWSGAMPAGFASLFGGAGNMGRTAIPTMLV